MKSVTKSLNLVHNRDDSTIGQPNLLNNYGIPLSPKIDFSAAYSFYSNEEVIKCHNNKYNSLRYNRDSKEIVSNSDMFRDYKNIRKKAKELGKIIVMRNNKPDMVLIDFERYKEIVQLIKKIENLECANEILKSKSKSDKNYTINEVFDDL